MGNHAVRAILHPGLQRLVIPAALFKEIERTITEQTVELLRLPGLMTGKVLALSIVEKSIAVFHCANLRPSLRGCNGQVDEKGPMHPASTTPY
jgi:hypothetical protein